MTRRESYASSGIRSDCCWNLPLFSSSQIIQQRCHASAELFHKFVRVYMRNRFSLLWYMLLSYALVHPMADNAPFWTQRKRKISLRNGTTPQKRDPLHLLQVLHPGHHLSSCAGWKEKRHVEEGDVCTDIRIPVVQRVSYFSSLLF